MSKWVVDIHGDIEGDYEIIKEYEEPKTGYWIDADGDNAICSCCNRLNHLYGTYCKHCGARIVEPKGRSDVLTVSFDTVLKDESVLCVARKCGEKIIMLKMEMGEQADTLYHLLTEQMAKAEIKSESEG